MKLLKLIPTIVILSSICSPGFSQEIPDNLKYLGQSRPGLTPEIFAPNIVSQVGHLQNITFMPDEKEIYFTVYTPNFDNAAIMVTKFENNQWTTPVAASFNISGNQNYSPFISLDGKKLYFTSQPTNGLHKIWVTNRTGQDWSEPVIMPEPINHPTTGSATPYIAYDSTLYFLGLNRPSGLGSTDIYRSPLINGSYSTVENLGEPINSPYIDAGMAISPDGKFMIFCSDRPGGQGEDLYISFQNENGTWKNPQNIGAPINTAADQISSRFSLDGKYFFYYSGNDMYWIDSKFFEKFLFGTSIKDSSFMHNGIQRTYLLHVPLSYDGTKSYPLIIGLHGLGSRGSEFQGSGFDSRADKLGFIMAYPDGYQNTWNIGGGTISYSSNADDVNFISTLIDTIASHYNIDNSRIYVTGHSQGGFMSYRLAAEIPNRIAAIAPLEGLPIGPIQNQATAPVALMHIHAMDDQTVPYNGTPPYVLSVDDAVSFWRQMNGCNQESELIFNKNGIIGTKWTAPQTKADVVLYTYAIGGHAWLPYATDLICDFFFNHPPRQNSVRITKPTLNDVFTTTSAIEITAEVNAVQNFNKVVFYANDEIIGEDANAPYSMTWTNPGVGLQFIQAQLELQNGEKIFSCDPSVIFVLKPNIALSKTVSSSSSENNQLMPGNAVDGNFFSRWSSQWSDPQWITIDLNSVHKISAITFVWETAYGRAYQIQLSTDGSIWKDVFSTDSSHGGTEYITFAPEDARFIRMYGTKRATQWGYSLWEFQVHDEEASDISESLNNTINSFALYQNYPNPFNASTKIVFELPKVSEVELYIFDVLGRKVRTLEKNFYTAGTHEVLWEGNDNTGNPLCSGIYFIQMQTGRQLFTCKALLLK